MLPCALIKLKSNLDKSKLNSVICNTVHDSIVMDVYPGEEEQIINMMKDAMLSIPQEVKRRYGIDYDMPIEIELKLGKNWLDTELINM